MPHYALAVDLGGSKILTALVDGAGGVRARHRAPTPPRGVEPVLEAITAGAQAVREAAGVRLAEIVAVSVGAPGPLDPRTGVIFEPPNIEEWHDVPLVDLLGPRVGLPVMLENDANAAAVGEWWIGAGRGVSDLIYITVSTGIGGGIIIGDRLVHGVSGTAGEVGHMTIDLTGPPCPCGRSTGCLEVLASGTAIARMAREAVQSGRGAALLARAGGDPAALDARIVEAAAREGDAVATAIFERAATYLGVGVANLLNLFNPARIVIGGGVSKAGGRLFEPVIRVARQRAFERPGRDAEIVPAALGDDVGVIGAAAVAFQRVGVRLR